MATLTYNELKPGKYIVLDGQPCVVLEFNFLRMQQRKPVAQTKIRNLITGKTMEKTFQQSDKAEEAELERKEVKYLYNNRGEFWFSDPKDPSKRFKIPTEILGEKRTAFLKTNSIVEILTFRDRTIDIILPIKLELKVKEAPPAVKGNTAQGGTKQIVLETGAIINAPLFINEGDTIVVNSETGEYVSRSQESR